MLVRINYVAVILIWATTPLAIKLGGDTLAPIAGLTLRLAVALMAGSLILTLGGFAGLSFRRNWKIYFAASISLFPNMALVYQAAEYLPSGLIALLFGLSPFTTALLAGPILGENLLQRRRLVAIAVASAGLLCILYDDVVVTGDSYLGITLMLVSSVLFSSSALWVKKLNAELSVEPLEQTLGAMSFALPGLLLCWVFVAGVEPLVFSPVSLVSLLYLALVASLFGFFAYYHILGNMSVSAVSVIPFITPVLAMALGVLVADETISPAMVVGAVLILVALLLHSGIRPARLMGWRSYTVGRCSKPGAKPCSETGSPS